MHAKLAPYVGVALLLVASGCLGGAKPASTEPTSSSPGSWTYALTPSRYPPPTTTAAPPPSGPLPVANVTVDVGNGSVPLAVNFTLSDSANSTESYTWSLDFGDGNATDGMALPVVVNHTYEGVGNYTANFTILGGGKSSLASVDIVAEAATVILQRVEASWEAGVSGCQPADVWVADTPLAGVTIGEFAVEAASIGRPFKASFTVGADRVWFGVAFYDVDHMNLDDNADDGTSLVITGVVPAGSVTGTLYSCDPDAGSAVYEAGIGL